MIFWLAEKLRHWAEEKAKDDAMSREISARYGIPQSHYDPRGAGGPMMPGYGLPSHYYGPTVDLGNGMARCRQWSDLTPQEQRNFVPPKLGDR